MEFRTHTGEIVTGTRLFDAINTTADFFTANAHGIFEEDLYADHVTNKQKAEYLKEALSRADKVRGGCIDNLAVWQRINTELTGECVALLNS